jgi:hypothetical protein
MWNVSSGRSRRASLFFGKRLPRCLLPEPSSRSNDLAIATTNGGNWPNSVLNDNSRLLANQNLWRIPSRATDCTRLLDGAELP